MDQSQQETLWIEPASNVWVSMRWSVHEGWRVYVSSRAAGEVAGRTPLSMQPEFYENLTLAEALDVVEAEVSRRRMF